MTYSTNDDVFTLGLSAQAFVVRGRPLERDTDADGPSGTIRLKGHGLSVDDVAIFEVTSGGALPTAISAFTPYYPIVVSFDLFKLSLARNGTPLTYVSVGSGWTIAIDPLRRLQRHREEAHGVLNQHLTAHGIEIVVDPVMGKYPQVLVGLEARMAARAAVTSLQIENAAYRVAVDRLFAQEEFDKGLLELFVKGWPVKGATDSTPTVADNGARASSSREALAWTTGQL